MNLIIMKKPGPSLEKIIQQKVINYDEGFIPFQFQKKVYSDNHQFKVLRIGRRAGKTELLVRWITDFVIEKKQDALVMAVDYGMLRDTHEVYFKTLLNPFLRQGLCQYHGSDYEFIFNESITTGKIMLRSAERPDRLRGLGKSIGRIALDEFAFYADQKYLYNDVLGPLHFDRYIEMIISSTPNGRDFFYELCQRGRDINFKKYKEFHFSSYANPYINKEKIEELIVEESWGPTQILENIEAEFSDMSSGVFGDYTKCIFDYPYLLVPAPQHKYIISADVAKTTDWTVLYVIDTNVKPYKVVYKERFQKVDWNIIPDKIYELSKIFNHATVYIDAQGVGAATYDSLKSKTTTVPITYTGHKSDLIDNLSMFISKGWIQWSKSDVDLSHELDVFRAKKLPSGKLEYNAPSGYHDDCLISLAMACSVLKNNMKTDVMPIVRREGLNTNDLYNKEVQKEKLKTVENWYKGIITR